jgi:hypothetical protein
MITGLPAYLPPVVEDVRCVCRAHYGAFIGGEDYQAHFAAKESMPLDAIFIDARATPFY